jgi:DNA mismatch repair protein MutS2
MVGALAELDLTLMCAKYAEDLHAAEPILEPHSGQKGSRSPVIVRLYQARHPLLDPESVVPIDLELDEKTFSLVITGPNTGGKTVTLKTVGLMVAMAQSGLQIPAVSGSSLRMVSDLYADIGDEQSIEQSLSTFSGHVTNIVHILRLCNSHTLVLLDELGAGTDPQEGAALARAILSNLVKLHVPCLVATHYPELKSFAHSTLGTTNASMEFDLHTLRPTYHLLVGLPGRSNAFLIAERLGIPEGIIQDARSGLDTSELRADDLLGEIHHQRDLTRHARKEAERSQRENDRLHRELQKRLDQIEEERTRLLEDARHKAQMELDEVRIEIEQVHKALKKSGKGLEETSELRQQVDDLVEKVEEPVRLEALPGREERQPMQLKAGERVRLRALGMDGVITAVGPEEVEVQAGALRVRARLEDLQRINKSGEPKDGNAPERGPVVAKGTVVPFYPSPGVELDLRGMRAEEALDRLEQHLEAAYLAGLPMVRIIHGKGTGKLREAVRQELRRSARVKAWETGLDVEGGEGVTIAKIVTD